MAMNQFLVCGALGSLMAVWTTGCNPEPARCPVLHDRYLLTYRPLAGPPCDIGPYEIDVVGTGAGTLSTTDTRPDAVIQTEVHLRGCTLSLDVEVSRPTVADMQSVAMSAATGNLTVYNENTISGVGTAVKYLEDGTPMCSGKFELNLTRLESAPPMAGTYF